MRIAVIAVPIVIALSFCQVQGQERESWWHSVRGMVVDKAGRPVVSATVYLKDVGGHRLKMKQTDRNGNFNFGMVSLRADHEIYAEQEGTLSQKVPIPSSTPRHDVVVKLKIETNNP